MSTYIRGAQGVVGIVMLPKRREGDRREMIHDPMRQVDIARRLSNLAKARRCGAKTRAGHPCRQAAVTGRARCRMHGGAKGSGGPKGNRNGNFKHGLVHAESKMLHRATCEQRFGDSGDASSGQPLKQ